MIFFVCLPKFTRSTLVPADLRSAGFEMGISPALVAKQCCAAAYLRGAFLGSGFVADPRGEFLSAVAASDVYRLFGSNGLPATEMPPPDTPVTGDISFHYRTGKHDQTPQDWSHYWDIADRYLPLRGAVS